MSEVSVTFEEILKNSAQAEAEAFLEDKFGHLQGKERWQAIRNFGAQNIIDFTELSAIGETRLFDADELAEFEEALNCEWMAGNQEAVSGGRDVLRKQSRFLKAAIAERAEETPPTPPETIRKFEAALQRMGFTARAAEKIAIDGFREK